MLRTIRLFAAIAVVLSSPISDSFAAVNNGTKSTVQSNAVDHRNYHKGFDAGYRAGFARGYRHAANTANHTPALVPVEMFGVRVYGANPCYQYNDRDWDFEKIC